MIALEIQTKKKKTQHLKPKPISLHLGGQMRVVD
jgi:hypothetical protein